MAQVRGTGKSTARGPGDGDRRGHSFLAGRHEYQPRRVFSTSGTDWQDRVDFDRMRVERLGRAREMMEKHDLGGLILFVGENVRYVTSVWQGNWKNNIFIRYAVLPRGGDPVLFETVGSDMVNAEIDAPWLREAAMWMAKHEWAKPGVREAEICARVNEYLYRSGFDFVYDIIVASGGNTSPYRRWHTDEVIRQGDLMIIDINAIGPGGYFIDF